MPENKSPPPMLTSKLPPQDNAAGAPHSPPPAKLSEAWREIVARGNR